MSPVLDVTEAKGGASNARGNYEGTQASPMEGGFPHCALPPMGNKAVLWNILGVGMSGHLAQGET